MIDCAFYGRVTADADPRISQAGKPWVRLRVGVGKDDDVQWVSIAVFGKAAQTAAKLRKGDRIYCEGTIKVDTWRGQDGTERHGLSVASFKVDRTHNIGRNRPERDERISVAGGTVASRPDRNTAGQDFHSDPIPFEARR
jgi:single-stranded DNA-binding protein